MRALLEGVDLGALDDGSARHACHLLGLSLLALGEPEEALRVTERGLRFTGGRCDLDVLVALSTPLPASPADPEPQAWSADQILIRGILRAVTSADACLARGDAIGARRALHCLAVTGSHEVQSLARRAEAWLLDEEPVEERRFDKAFALAASCDAHGDKSVYTRRDLLLPSATWDKARLDDVARRATAWLDATMGAPWPAATRV